VAVRQVAAATPAAGRPDLLRLGARPASPGEPPLLVADTSRLRDEVGWRPRIDLAEGLRQSVAWWKERGREDGIIPHRGDVKCA
jgi:nucleoside-diphosphate-sugar epimerase